MQVNKDNYQEYLLLLLDDELSVTEKAEVENFIRENGDAAAEWKLLQKTRLVPEKNIVYANKSSLFREEETIKIFKLNGFRTYISAAAAIAALITLVIFFRPTHTVTPELTDKYRPQKTRKMPTHMDSTVRIEYAHSGNEVKKEKMTPEPKHSLAVRKQQSIPVASNKQQKQAEKIQVPEIQIPQQKEVVKEPEVAVQKQPEAPVKIVNVTNPSPKTYVKYQPESEDDEGLKEKAISLLRGISIKKQNKKDGSSYAIKLETKKIKVSKTIWANY